MQEYKEKKFDFHCADMLGFLGKRNVLHNVDRIRKYQKQMGQEKELTIKIIRLGDEVDEEDLPKLKKIVNIDQFEWKFRMVVVKKNGIFIYGKIIPKRLKIKNGIGQVLGTYIVPEFNDLFHVKTAYFRRELNIECKLSDLYCVVK